MELEAFVSALSRLTAEDLRAIACAIDEHHQTVADEVEAWEDMMCIDDALRRNGCSHRAAHAAHLAVRAVRDAAEAASIEFPDSVVTRVAREAALFARALVAGDDAGAAVRHLLREWGVLSTVAA